MKQSTLYNYICPMCGNEVNSHIDNIRQCPTCDYWYLVVSYPEGKGIINKEAYKTIAKNASNGLKHKLHCPECQITANFYCNDVPGITCHCGGFMEAAAVNYSQISKDIRKRNKITQERMAKLLGMTRSMLSQVETGTRTLPSKAQPILTKMLQSA